MGLIAKKPSPPEANMTFDLTLGPVATHSEERRSRILAAEWYPQSGVQLTWPHAGTDWAPILDEVTECYVRLAYEIASRGKLLVVTPEPDSVDRLLTERLPGRVKANVTLFDCPTDDTWARDHGFLTVVGGRRPELLDFRFDGWGGKFPAARDNAINRRLHESGLVKGDYVPHLDFILEGGSIESDGKGTILTTSACLLNPNRNAGIGKKDIEERFRDWFGAERVLWLDHGQLAGDDTDGHVDTLARLCPDDTIVYVRCDRPDDPHHAELRAMEEQLRSFRTPADAPYRLIPLPWPEAVYAPDGERLPATYANYLVTGTAILYPTYGQPANDEAARRALAQAFTGYDIVGIDCRVLLRQHGSLHCATMQYPAGVL